MEQYKYVCLLDGIVKAYKKMTRQKVQDLNQVLEKQHTCGRWTATTTGGSAQFG